MTKMMIISEANDCFVKRSVRKVLLIVVILLFTAAMLSALGCEKALTISGREIALDSEQLDLNGAGVENIDYLKRLKDLKFLDLRNNDISVNQIHAIQEELPSCEILWSVPIDSLRFDSNSVTIQDPNISLESASLLQCFPDLEAVDATGSEKYDELRELVKRFPQIHFSWTVRLGLQVWPNTTRAISISMQPADVDQIEQALFGFLNLESVDLLNSTVSQERIASWKQRYPNITFRYSVNIADRTFYSDATSIDLSQNDAVNLKIVENALLQLSNLKRVNLRGCNLSVAEKKQLIAKHPRVAFDWVVEVLPGLMVDSADPKLIASNHNVPDLENFAEKLEVLPALQQVEMCYCGLSDEQMMVLRERFPSIKFIWIIHVGFWDLRTDVVAFSLANIKDFPGGRLVGDEYWRYSNFTEDSLKPLQYCTDLIALDIGHAGNIKDLSNIAGLTKLQYLIVAMTRAPDIKAISNMPDLVYLEIFSMKITDLSPLLACKKLEYLNCSNCKFRSIDELVQLKNLKRLWIINSGLKEEQMNALKTSLTNTVVKTKGEHPTDSGWRVGNPEYIKMRKLFHLG